MVSSRAIGGGDPALPIHRFQSQAETLRIVVEGMVVCIITIPPSH